MNMMLKNRLLVWAALIVMGDATFNDSGIAATLNTSEGIFQLKNFSHIPQEISTFQSAFAYAATEQEFAVIQSDPPFVTGAYSIIFHPLAPIFTPTLSSYTLSSHGQGNLITAPFSFNGVSGFASGENQISYADANFNQLASVTLKSTSQLTLSEINHSISTVGQAGFQGSFNLASNETFSFTINSSLSSFLDNSDLNQSEHEHLDIKQSQVIYFWAKPADINFPNLILMFPLYPQLSIAVNDSRVEAGLLAIKQTFTPQTQNSLEVSQNSTSLENFSDFQLNPNSTGLDHSEWRFEYITEQPINLTVVAYTSNNITSIQSDYSTQEPVGIPESWGFLHHFFIGFALFFFIKIK